jgi:hypothetical protein
MQTQEQMLKIANIMIAEGKQAREGFAARLMVDGGRAMESADRLFPELAKIEFGEYLHGMVVGTQNVQFDLIIESLTGFVVAHSTTAAEHTSSHCSNMMKAARLEVAAKLLRRLQENF